MSPIKIIISGGGTGGHIFPAIAIARAIQHERPDTEILFVGAEGKMEMEKVPQAGYQIIGLPIVGIQRRLTWKNIQVPFKIWKSFRKARRIIQSFQPAVAIGVGGYASGPLLRAAAARHIPTVIQEQNSYPGITNKILSSKAQKICVAYPGMERWFSKDKIVFTGNPIRPEVVDLHGKRERAFSHFNLSNDRLVLLVIGGSLGARTINEAVARHAQQWIAAGMQVIWQTGKNNEAVARTSVSSSPHLHIHTFIQEMDLAYTAADIIVSRAGAIAISELCWVGKPCILIPSPYVAEDHQTKNAMVLAEQQATIIVRDAEAKEKLGDVVVSLTQSPAQMQSLSAQIKKFGKADAARQIALEVFRLADK